ncbi:unnamed protein product [Arctogadus glacialis]
MNIYLWGGGVNPPPNIRRCDQLFLLCPGPTDCGCKVDRLGGAHGNEKKNNIYFKFSTSPPLNNSAQGGFGGGGGNQYLIIYRAQNLVLRPLLCPIALLQPGHPSVDLRPDRQAHRRSYLASGVMLRRRMYESRTFKENLQVEELLLRPAWFLWEGLACAC